MQRQIKQCEGDNLACFDLPGVDYSILLSTGMPFFASLKTELLGQYRG